VSPEAIDFIMKTLLMEPKERPRADELPRSTWLVQSIGEAAMERNFAQSKANDESLVLQVSAEARNHDLTMNLPSLRAFQEQRMLMQTVTVSGAITFFKIGRYVCEKNLALLTNKPLFEIHVVDSDVD